MLDGDIEDAAVVQRATQGCDAVVHLAARVDDAPFEELLGPNVRGLFNVMDAARSAGVRRVVLASSIQVAPRRYRDGDGPLSTNTQKPDNHYALTKVWAEDMGQMYARCYGLSVLAVRVAFMVRDEREARYLVEHRVFELYLSRGDVARCFALAVEADFDGFEVVYAIGPEGASTYDPEPARRLLGFEAHDRWPQGLGFTPPK